jgi:hypothetical protein
MIFSWVVSQVGFIVVEYVVRVNSSSRALIMVEEVVHDVGRQHGP